eukprot:6456143-Amphidinium_carterae.1
MRFAWHGRMGIACQDAQMECLMLMAASGYNLSVVMPSSGVVPFACCVYGLACIRTCDLGHCVVDDAVRFCFSCEGLRCQVSARSDGMPVEQAKKALECARLAHVRSHTMFIWKRSSGLGLGSADSCDDN